jgi:hypothetical protein
MVSSLVGVPTQGKDSYQTNFKEILKADFRYTLPKSLMKKDSMVKFIEIQRDFRVNPAIFTPKEYETVNVTIISKVNDIVLSSKLPMIDEEKEEIINTTENEGFMVNFDRSKLEDDKFQILINTIQKIGLPHIFVCSLKQGDTITFISEQRKLELTFKDPTGKYNLDKF